MIDYANMTPEIARKLRGRGGSRQVSFEYWLTKNGVERQLLNVISCRLSMSADAEIKLAAAFALEHIQQEEYLNGAVRPFAIIGGVRFALGEYIITTSDTSYQNGAVTDNLEAYDLTLILKQYAPLERTYFDAGTPYLEAVKTLLFDAGFLRIQSDENAALLAEAREWELGTNALSIVNTLLQEINFSGVYADMDGNINLRRKSDVSAGSVLHTYSDGEASVIFDGNVSTIDYFAAYNAFVAVVKNPDTETPMTAVSINDDPTSALSTVSRGRAITAPVIYVDNIATQGDLQEYVDDIKNKSRIQTETINFTTALMPTHGIGDIIALETSGASGVYVEKSWSMELKASGGMTHKATRSLFV